MVYWAVCWRYYIPKYMEQSRKKEVNKLKLSQQLANKSTAWRVIQAKNKPKTQAPYVCLSPSSATARPQSTMMQTPVSVSESQKANGCLPIQEWHQCHQFICMSTRKQSLPHSDGQNNQRKAAACSWEITVQSSARQPSTWGTVVCCGWASPGHQQELPNQSLGGSSIKAVLRMPREVWRGHCGASYIITSTRGDNHTAGNTEPIILSWKTKAQLIDAWENRFFDLSLKFISQGHRLLCKIQYFVFV